MTLYVKDRSVILRDPDTGHTRVFNKGDEIPEELEDQFSNGSVVEEFEDEEDDTTGKVRAAKATADTQKGDADDLVEEDDEEPSEDDEDDEEAAETTGEESPEDLDENFTVPQLRSLAEDEGVDLDGASKKADIIDRIIANRADNG